jgi:hypothetical protein
MDFCEVSMLLGVSSSEGFDLWINFDLDVAERAIAMTVGQVRTIG